MCFGAHVAIEKWTSFESSLLAVHRTADILSLKLGVLPLWSASKELSNNVMKVIIDDGHIFAKNCTQAKINPWFFTILGQNSTHSKIDIAWKLYSCWSQWFKFQIHISFLPRDTYNSSLCTQYTNGDRDCEPQYMCIWMKYSDRNCANEALFVLNSTA